MKSGFVPVGNRQAKDPIEKLPWAKGIGRDANVLRVLPWRMPALVENKAAEVAVRRLPDKRKHPPEREGALHRSYIARDL